VPIASPTKLDQGDRVSEIMMDIEEGIRYRFDDSGTCLAAIETTDDSELEQVFFRRKVLWQGDVFPVSSILLSSRDAAVWNRDPGDNFLPFRGLLFQSFISRVRRV
jgi:hypothetical protein